MNKVEEKIFTGVSSACFFPLETALSVQKIAAWQIPYTEVFFNTVRELAPDYVDGLDRCCKLAGTKILSVHPFTSNSESFYFFSDYPGRLEDGILLYRHYLRAAQKLGARLLVFHGDSSFSEYPVRKSADHLRRLDAIAREEYGLFIAYENVVRCRGKDPNYFVQLREYYPDLRFVLDVKQSLRAGHSPLEYVEALGNSIVHVHISDSNSQQDCLPVGRGEMKLEEFLFALKKVGFSGAILQELYRESYREEGEVLEGYQLLKRTTERIFADIL